MQVYDGPAHMSQEELARVDEWAAAIVDATPIEVFQRPPVFELQLNGRSLEEDRARRLARVTARHLELR